MTRPDRPDDAPHELDALLSAFYRSEMPEPWPALQAPIATPEVSKSATRSWWTRSRSHLALAASVALLIVASWWLTARTPTYTAPINVPTGAGEADIKKREEMRKIEKEREKRGQQPNR